MEYNHQKYDEFIADIINKWRSGGKPRKVENITTGEIFDYVKDAYTTYPMKFDTLRNAILQNKPDKYGNYWRYLDE